MTAVKGGVCCLGGVGLVPGALGRMEGLGEAGDRLQVRPQMAERSAKYHAKEDGLCTGSCGQLWKWEELRK